MKACKWTHQDIIGSNPSHADFPNPQTHTRDGRECKTTGGTTNKQVDRIVSLPIMA